MSDLKKKMTQLILFMTVAFAASDKDATRFDLKRIRGAWRICESLKKLSGIQSSVPVEELLRAADYCDTNAPASSPGLHCEGQSSWAALSMAVVFGWGSR